MLYPTLVNAPFMRRGGGGCNRLLRLVCVLTLLAAGPAQAENAPGIWLETLTSPEAEALIAKNHRTVLIPTGGTEQNGAQIALGKHNAIVRETAERIARARGNTLIAPIIAYVPEGGIGEGHMRYAGTLSLREETFEALLEDAARSLKAHGFTLIAFLGDSGGNQEGQARVAEKLTREWADDGVRVLTLARYYDMAQNGERALLETRGYSAREAEKHAGIADAAELYAADPTQLRDLTPYGLTPEALKALGNQLLNLKTQAALGELK